MTKPKELIEKEPDPIDLIASSTTDASLDVAAMIATSSEEA